MSRDLKAFGKRTSQVKSPFQAYVYIHLLAYFEDQGACFGCSKIETRFIELIQTTQAIMSTSDRYTLNIESQSVYSHFGIFVAILITNIIAILSSIVAIFHYLRRVASEKQLVKIFWRRFFKLKPFYYIYISSLCVDILCNMLSSFRFLSTSSVLIHEIFTFFSLNMIIFQIYNLLFMFFEIQRVFAVLDGFLETIIKPIKIGLHFVTLACFLCLTSLQTFQLITSTRYDFVFIVNVSVFLVFSLASVTVAVYSLLMIRRLLKQYSLERTVGFNRDNQSPNNDSSATEKSYQKELKQVDRLQIILVTLVSIVFLLVILICIVFLVGVALVDEAVALAASFLTILTLLLFYFFEECKKLAPIQPIRKQDPTNRYDFEVMNLQPLNDKPKGAQIAGESSGIKYAQETRLIHEKATILIK